MRYIVLELVRFIFQHVGLQRLWQLWQAHRIRVENFPRELEDRLENNVSSTRQTTRRLLAAIFLGRLAFLCGKCQGALLTVGHSRSTLKDAKWCFGCSLLVEGLTSFIEVGRIFSGSVKICNHYARITASVSDRTILFLPLKGSSHSILTTHLLIARLRRGTVKHMLTSSQEPTTLGMPHLQYILHFIQQGRTLPWSLLLNR
jgi:hypothetical protein